MLYNGELFRKILGSTKALAVLLKPDGTIGDINSEAAALLGHTVDEIVGQNWFELVIPPRFFDELTFVFDNMMLGNLTSFDLYNSPVLTKDGIERIGSWSYIRLTDGEDNGVGVLVSGVDITEHIRADEELSSAVESSKFLLDQITTQLQAILVAVGQIDHSVSDPAQKTAIDIILKSVEACTRIIRDAQDEDSE